MRRGTRPLTILFESGGAADIRSWGEVPHRLGERTEATIVMYDRAGLGTSGLGPLSLTPRQEVLDIRSGLTQLDLPEKTVIVAHSYGAMLALAHAGMYRNRVAGLVLVDPMNPRFVAEVGAWLKSTIPEIPDPQTNRDYVIRRMSGRFDSLSARMLALEPKLDLPMVIISSGKDWWGSEEADVAWRKSHKEMAGVSADRQRLVAENSGHDIPADAPELVVSAILKLLTELPDPGGRP